MMPMKRNQNWLPSIFNDFFDTKWLESSSHQTPAINVFETDEAYKIAIAAPGMCKDDFDVHVDEYNNLVIRMEKKSECCCDDGKCENPEEHKEAKEKKKEGRFLRREFSYSKFEQTMILPDNVDKEHIEAKVKNGILKIKLPKMAPCDKDCKKQVIEIK
ncbi:MAG: Hsp20/alpha crystallin family protein [Bacteroides sp.]|jgi:HSP20 family protein|nr:Hsp20/alpha crystallin family protein [Bacteroides sp.]MBR0042265.1 Hsp20/alpha crystallin family protein [Bacteroides sp.]